MTEEEEGEEAEKGLGRMAGTRRRRQEKGDSKFGEFRIG